MAINSKRLLFSHKHTCVSLYKNQGLSSVIFISTRIYLRSKSRCLKIQAPQLARVHPPHKPLLSLESTVQCKSFRKPQFLITKENTGACSFNPEPPSQPRSQKTQNHLRIHPTQLNPQAMIQAQSSVLLRKSPGFPLQTNRVPNKYCRSIIFFVNLSPYPDYPNAKNATSKQENSNQNTYTYTWARARLLTTPKCPWHW